MAGKIVGEETLKAFHSDPRKNKDMMLKIETEFTKGGVCQYSNFSLAAEGYFGWVGYGGSIFFWNPTHKISFAYVPLNYDDSYMRHY